MNGRAQGLGRIYKESGCALIQALRKNTERDSSAENTTEHLPTTSVRFTPALTRLVVPCVASVFLRLALTSTLKMESTGSF